MKQYPSIFTNKENKIDFESNIIFYVFDKLDGSNIRIEWNKKKGFVKFGTRKRLLGTDQGILNKSLDLAKNLEDEMHEILKKNFSAEKITCFFEFYGSNSFAGSHNENDQFNLTLLDLFIEKQGFLEPKKYLQTFESSNVSLPKLLTKSRVDGMLINLVEEGKMPGMTFEGVVCKAPAQKKWQLPLMIKIKNKAWIEKVKQNYDPKLWNEIL